MSSAKKLSLLKPLYTTRQRVNESGAVQRFYLNFIYMSTKLAPQGANWGSHVGGTVEKELKEMGKTWRSTRDMAKDARVWRDLLAALHTTSR